MTLKTARDIQKLNPDGLPGVLVSALVEALEHREILISALNKYRLNQTPAVNAASIADEAFRLIEHTDNHSLRIERA